jgi:hypothetical protein
MGTPPKPRGEGTHRGEYDFAPKKNPPAPGEWARRTRAEQGLPPKVTDAVTLSNIAVIARASLRSIAGLNPPDRLKPGRIKEAGRLSAVDGHSFQYRHDGRSLPLQREGRPDIPNTSVSPGRELA